MWLLSSSSDRRALDVVDGAGAFEGLGPHYSRRTPGSKTFTGVGQEIVLVSDCGRAVWACVRQKTPMARGTGGSRGRSGQTDAKARYVFRNMLFRNLGAGLSSELIQDAVKETIEKWIERYGDAPSERLRTEIAIDRVKSTNPGFCYLKAGWERGQIKRGKLILWAPLPVQYPQRDRPHHDRRQEGRERDQFVKAEQGKEPENLFHVKQSSVGG